MNRSRKQFGKPLNWSADREVVFMISPGILLLLVGVGVILAPRFFLALMAVFFVTMGALFCFVGWKLVQLKRKVSKMARDFEAKVYVHGVQVARAEDSDNGDSADSKKVILH